MSKFVGVVILESLRDPHILDDRVTIIKKSDIKAPPGDPYPIWSRRLVEVDSESMMELAESLAANMVEDFYNHFVDEKLLVVVFKGRYFVLDKFDKQTWQPMVEYGKTVRVGPEWTLNIPVEYDRLL
ncbi:MAG: hypothetical protein K6T83_02000 [Alicyclobacillus sp.]|nr:hypothetical protein [Alicyclobacillus sp.]